MVYCLSLPSKLSVLLAPSPGTPRQTMVAATLSQQRLPRHHCNRMADEICTPARVKRLLCAITGRARYGLACQAT